MAFVSALSSGSMNDFFRPCVDCGKRTGRFCDGIRGDCFAASRVPSEMWNPGQRTPLCSLCDNLYDACHFCRNIPSCTPFPDGKNPAADVQESEPEAEDSCLEGDRKRRILAGPPATDVYHYSASRVNPTTTDAKPAGDLHEENQRDEQENYSMEHLHDDEQEILDEEWKEGDIFCGVEPQIPIPPEGFEWIPYYMHGRYRLRKIDDLPDDVMMEETN